MKFFYTCLFSRVPILLWRGHHPLEVVPLEVVIVFPLALIATKKVLSLSLFGLTNQVKARVLFCIGSYSAKGTFICNSHYYNNPF